MHKVSLTLGSLGRFGSQAKVGHTLEPLRRFSPEAQCLAIPKDTFPPPSLAFIGSHPAGEGAIHLKNEVLLSPDE